jgi:hypothetical protein
MINGNVGTQEMTFIGFDKVAQYVDKFREAISEQPEKEVLDGMTFVMNETDIDRHALQNCHGVTLSIETLRDNTAKKVTLLGWLPLEFIRTKKPEVDFLLSKENFRFLSLPATPKDIIAAWQKPTEVVEGADPGAIQGYTQRKIGQLLHIIHGADPRNPANDTEAQSVKTMIRETRKEFPSLAGSTDDEVIDFLLAASAKRDEVRKGENLSGVFCDIEGTILVDGNIRQDTLEKLEEYEAQGKSVVLWTDGDIDEISPQLRKHGIEYPIHAKADYAGATVEVAIDDLDEHAFTARTKIQAKTFVRA